MACWKARAQLPIRHNWTFFASSYCWGLQGKTCQDSLISGGGRLAWANILGGRGRPGEYFLVSTKLDTFCYLTVQTAPCYVPSFWHNTGVWQMDRQTDGIAAASTALAMRALRQAVKMDCYTTSGQTITSNIWSIHIITIMIKKWSEHILLPHCSWYRPGHCRCSL